MKTRKDVNVYLSYRSGKFFHVVVKFRNAHGALRSVLSILQNLNLKVLGSFSSVGRSAKMGVWSAFVEGSRHTVPELKQKISSSRYVLDCIVLESKNGFLVDGVHFPLCFNTGDRAVLMRAEHLARMLMKVREEFGTGGNAIVYEEGRAYGLGVASYYTKRFGVEFVRSNLVEFLKIYQALGWFRLEEVERSERGGSLTVRASESFECRGRRSDGPHSHFVRGHICGALTSILGREMVCEETRCVAAGNKHCEFVLSPRAGATGLA